MTVMLLSERAIAAMSRLPYLHVNEFEITNSLTMIREVLTVNKKRIEPVVPRLSLTHFMSFFMFSGGLKKETTGMKWVEYIS